MTTQIAEIPQPPVPARQDNLSGAALVMNEDAMRQCHSLATVMAAGVATVPKHLQKNVGDCMAVVMQAMQWGMNPYAVAQKTHIVNGTLGYEAQLVNAVITTMAPTKGRLQYDWFGDWKGVNGKTSKSDAVGVRVWATLKGEDTPRELPVTMAEAGVRNSPLWEQSPKIQLAYLAVKRWARLYTPDVILGVYTPDEFAPPTRSMGAAPVIHPEPSAELGAEADAAAAKGAVAYQKFWTATGKDNRKLLQSGHEARKAAALGADQDRTVENASMAAPLAAATAEPAADAKAAPIFTYAQVMERLLAARDADALAIAADLIGAVADPEQRRELVQSFEELQAQLMGGVA